MKGGHFGVDSSSDMKVSEHHDVQEKSVKWGVIPP